MGTPITVLGTARPWNFAAIAASAGGATVQVGFNANKQDGSNAGGVGSQNNTFTYGEQHVSPAGETAPHTVAVTPGNIIVIVYGSGTVAAFSGGTNFGPRGDTSATSGLSPTIDFTSANGYVYPSDCMPAAKSFSGTNPTIGRVGLCGVFTDSSGVIIANSFWDWKSKGGTDTANSSIALPVPAGAAFLSIGINDSLLRDNTGSFAITVYSDTSWSYTQAFTLSGKAPIFARYPVGISTLGYLVDKYPNLLSNIFVGMSFTPIYLAAPLGGFRAGYVGQLFPHGAQSSGGTVAGQQGQVFPY
jgi:hypothetical protein